MNDQPYLKNIWYESAGKKETNIALGLGVASHAWEKVLGSHMALVVFKLAKNGRGCICK